MSSSNSTFSDGSNRVVVALRTIGEVATAALELAAVVLLVLVVIVVVVMKVLIA